MANKTLDQWTQAAAKPGIFALMAARDADLSTPESRAFALHFLMETVLDALTVVDTQTVDPTALSPSKGDIYVIGGTGAGAWAGQDNKVAVYDGASWTYMTPQEGWRFYDQTANEPFYYSGTAWLALGPKAGTGTITDTNSEVAVAFTTAFPDANYTPVVTGVAGLSLLRIKTGTIATTGFTVERVDTALQSLETSGAENFGWVAIRHRDT